MRLFAALELPPEPRTAAAAMIRELRRSGADVKWVAPENLHVTLKFLGETDPGRLGEIGAVLQAACSAAPALELALAGAGAFPGVGRPAVVWLGLAGQVEALAGLARALDDGLAGLGFPPETRRFQAHLTLGRARRGRGPNPPSRPPGPGPGRPGWLAGAGVRGPAGEPDGEHPDPGRPHLPAPLGLGPGLRSGGPGGLSRPQVGVAGSPGV